jgi:hypothetical protein
MSRLVSSICLATAPFLSGCLADAMSSVSLFRPAADTRIFAVGGNLAFGDVPVGDERDLTVTITNAGNAPLWVTRVSINRELADQTLTNWHGGQILPGASQPVGVRFRPLAAGTYHGTITLHGDFTGGTNTVHVSAAGTAPAVMDVTTGADGALLRIGL